MSAAQQHAAAILAAVTNQLTPEQSRHVFLAVSDLVMAARDAERHAYLIMAGTEHAHEVAEFNHSMRESLKRVHEQLKFIGTIVNGKKEEVVQS